MLPTLYHFMALGIKKRRQLYEDDELLRPPLNVGVFRKMIRNKSVDVLLEHIPLPYIETMISN
jgi:hypothetical protein